ncbi:putative GTPase activating protein for Arf-domain-containing protein [Cyathus striatus]|nr:putative GTPase activating protein for Arf-domain-containing protein [Cyathus striatus]
MGTHISKVKSVDLDVWTPEQMESIQKWGNHRANLYWEAHLKPGHIPPEHKMESFIRSKYESRRWALEGPLPSDPSVLEDRTVHESTVVIASQLPSSTPLPASVTHSTHTSTSSISGHHTLLSSRQPQGHQLLSSAYTTQQPVNMHLSASSGSTQTQHPLQQQQQQQQQQQPTAPQNDLFNLDFHAPSLGLPSNSPPAPAKKDVKQDILSLFSNNTAIVQPTSPFNTTGGSVWGGAQAQHQSQTTSMTGTNGTGVWGANSGWNSAASLPSGQGNLWGNTSTPTSQQQQTGLFNTDEIWKGSGSAPLNANTTQDLFSSPFSTSGTAQKKDDVFGDLWGGFK